MRIPPLRIVLSGGGIRGTAHAGALQCLEQKGMLRTVREYIGVSAGALIAFCICIGYSIDTIASFSKDFDFSCIRTLEPEVMFHFFDAFGLDNGDRLKKLLESLLRQKKLPTDLTFQQLREKLPGSPALRIFASDIYNCQPVEFSEKASPNIPIAIALSASMAIPGYFTPVKHPETGVLLVDGAILHNLATEFLNSEEKKHTLTIGFSIDHHRVKQIDTIYEFFEQIYGCFHIPRTLRIVNENSEQMIIIPCGDYPMWDFEASSETRKKLIDCGFTAAQNYLDMKNRPLQSRRFSVT